MNQVLWGLRLVQFLGPPLRKKKQNYKYKFGYEIEYLLRVSKETTQKLKKIKNKSKQIKNSKTLTVATNIIKFKRITYYFL
jgi:thioredoxin reductase